MKIYQQPLLLSLRVISVVRTKVSALKKDHKDNIPFSSIWKALCLSVGEPDRENQSSFESETLERKISKKIIGSILRNFGGKPRFTMERCYFFRDDMLEIINDKYFVTQDDISDFHIMSGLSNMEDLLEIRK